MISVSCFEVGFCESDVCFRGVGTTTTRMSVYIYMYNVLLFLKAVLGRLKYLSLFVSRHFRVISLRDFYLRCFAPKFPVLVGNR